MANPLSETIRAANEALIRRWELDAIGEYFAPTYVAHLTGQDMDGGPGAVRRVLELWRRAFPELHVEVAILVEGADRVAWQRTLQGVQQGAYAGFPASQRLIVWRDLVVSRFEAGVIAEEWVVSDLAERLLLARKA